MMQGGIGYVGLAASPVVMTGRSRLPFLVVARSQVCSSYEKGDHMNNSAYYSVVLDQPAQEVWDTVRDFNSYPIWVNRVEESHIEDDLPAPRSAAYGTLR